MAAYDAGDLSQREFCEVHGVAYSTFGYWRKRLKGERARPSSAQASALLDVTSLLSAQDDSWWQVELELPSGLKLRLR